MQIRRRKSPAEEVLKIQFQSILYKELTIRSLTCEQQHNWCNVNSIGKH